MILKLLVIIGVVFTVYLMFFKKREISEDKKSRAKPKKDIPMNEMVECASCGIYAELDDSILSNNKYYCSQECVDKA
jgi:uncharacterized protein